MTPECRGDRRRAATRPSRYLPDALEPRVMLSGAALPADTPAGPPAGPPSPESLDAVRWRGQSVPARRGEWILSLDESAAGSPSRPGVAGAGADPAGRVAALQQRVNRRRSDVRVLESEWPALRRAFEAWLAPANFDAQGRQRTRLADLTRPLLKRRRG